MPWPKGNKGNKGNNNNNNGNDNGYGDANEDPFCPYCANGMANDCPYWSNINGQWVHDRSGAAGYDESVIKNDKYGVWDKLPKTPMPDEGNDKKKKKGRDDDKGPGKFRLW